MGIGRIVVTRALPGPVMDLLRDAEACWVNPDERTLRPD